MNHASLTAWNEQENDEPVSLQMVELTALAEEGDVERTPARVLAWCTVGV